MPNHLFQFINMNEILSPNKKIAAHPSTQLKPATVADLRAHSFEAEQLGHLHPDQLSTIYCERWFNLFVPEAYGGLGLSLPDALRMEEAFAWTDGSLGWTITLCAGANWFIGFLQPDAAREIFANPKVCLAGSGRPSGVAQKTATGYTITGSWKYATGAPHATIFTANCRIEQEGKPLLNEQGEPLVQAFWFRREEVTINADWRTIGMVATASHSFSVKEVSVPANRTFVLDPGQAIISDMAYRYPFLPFAEATLAVNYSGMALHFLELMEPVIAAKQQQAGVSEAAKQLMKDNWEKANTQLRKRRIAFYEAVEQSWVEANHEVTDQAGVPIISATTLQEVSATSRQLASLAKQLVDELYPFGGIAAADPQTAINLVWRDMHTATQHTLLTLPQE